MTDTWLPAPASPVTVLGVVRETVGDLGEVFWAARSAEVLLETVRQIERLRSVLDAVQLQVVAEIAATDAARAEGWGSTKDFLTATTGGRKGVGRETVSLAEAVTTDRTAVGRALAAGRISRPQAQVIVRAVDQLPLNPGLRDAAEALLIGEARTRDATELADAGRHVLERLDPDGVEARDERAADREARSAHAGRHLSIVEDGLGGVRIRGRGTVEDAAWITSSLFPLAAPQPLHPAGECGANSVDRAGACGTLDCAHDGRDPRDHGARLWDALVEACRLLAGTEVLPASHGATPRITVTIDYERLRDQLDGQVQSHPGTALLDLGGSLSAHSVRRLACDAEILPMVLGSRSQVLDVGRLHRLVPLALWLVLVARDRHCAFPGCTRPPVACDAHHITHWADGGATSLANLVLLCRRHHTIIHTTPWEVRLDPRDQRPEFLPPASLDPQRRPLRRRPLRE